MNTQTPNLSAFQEVTRALAEIDRYNTTRNFEHLERADSALAVAREQDGGYVDALLYSGMVQDLLGKAADASPFFERIFKESKEENLRIEAEFNLAVSHYHQYDHENLAKAERHFLAVIGNAKTEEALRNLAEANLAQTYAMWSRPSGQQHQALNTGHGQEIAVYNHIRQMHEQSLKWCNKVRGKLGQTRTVEPARQGIWKKISATADNAAGMAYMYLFDYPVPGKSDDATLLQKALEELNQAEAKLPADWANTSDLGSVHLRLGILERRGNRDPKEEFERAEEYLKLVVTRLRPGYGFAFHELGRLNRVWERWDRAIKYFQRALDVPERYRDISDRGVLAERARAEQCDSNYP
jgi:tetratricopeptide (TPR) repeat protein